MYFHFKFIVFSWIFNYIFIRVAADNIKFGNVLQCPADRFRVTSLSHSSLLISWNAEDIFSTDVYDTGKYKKDFTWYLDEGNNKSGSFFCEDCYSHFKISSLRENTNYLITIEDKDNEKICWIEGKTIFNTNQSLPTKPYFVVIEPIYLDYEEFYKTEQPTIYIDWFPCGRKGYCENEEVAGSHFSVKYKMLDSRQEWITYEYDRAYKVLYGLLPGRLYEIIVTSITGNADLKTDSDPQQVSISPVCSSVRFVRIITLTNSSILVSWEEPKERLSNVHIKEEYFNYVIFYSVFDSSRVILLNYSQYTNNKPYQEKKLITNYYNINFKFKQIKLSDLISGARYIFHIVPYVDEDGDRNTFQYFGLSYTIDYNLQIYPDNLSLARPQFSLEFYNGIWCEWRIQWLPCGRTYDCKNSRPGSYFAVKYRNETDRFDSEKIEEESDWVSIRLYPGNTYKISVESRDKFNNSKSSKKKTISTHDCKRNSK